MIYLIIGVVMIIGLIIYCNWGNIVTEIKDPKIEGEG